MASNPYVNKVQLANGTTLIDLSADTVAAGKMLSGIKAHDKSGATVTGTIPTKTASNLSASGKTVTVPAGYYASQATKDVATGSATTPATTITVAPTISVDTSTGLITVTNSKTQSVTPTVSAGYVASGTAGTITVNGSNTKQMTVKGAATYNASTSDQEIAAGQFLTGKQTIRKVTTSGIDAANIKDGAVVKVGDSGSATRIKNVTGTFTDASTATSTHGAAGADQIMNGYSAWVDGAEVTGTFDMFALTVNELKALTL